MSEHRQRHTCLLKYLVRGVDADRASQQALTAELEEMLNHVSAVTVLPVVEGFTVELNSTTSNPSPPSVRTLCGGTCAGDALRQDA